MAEFRKYVYALALVALLAGLTAPASAQAPYSCSTTAAVPPPLRAEGWTEQVGDIIIDCTGGNASPNGTPIATQVDITVTLSTHITSQITARVNNIAGANTPTTNFSEALLIADQPNTNSLLHPVRPVLNCGNNVGGANAPDNGPEGAGVCDIVAAADPSFLYDGTPNAFGGGSPGFGGVVTCSGGGGTPSAGTYGCGRPNVFQGRQSPVNGPPGQLNQNAIIFLGVPVDQPGISPNCDPINFVCHHIYRITNLRADIAELGIGGGAGGGVISADVSVSNSSFLPIGGQQVLGTQLISLLVARFATSLAPIQSNPTLTLIGCKDTNDSTATLTFAEVEPDAFKVKNVGMLLANWQPNGVTLYRLNPNIISGAANATYAADTRQNIPGGGYSTENGFSNPPGQPEAPVGTPSIGTPNTLSGSLPFSSGTGTGISTAGTVISGTRLFVNLKNVFGATGGAGAVQVLVPSVVLLTNQLSGVVTGAAALTQFPPTIDNVGAGNFAAAVGNINTLVNVPLPNTAACVLPTSPNPTTAAGTTCWGGQLVYEIIFADPGVFEKITIPVTVRYTAIGLSQVTPLSPGPIAMANGRYAPFYGSTAAPNGANWAEQLSAQASAGLTSMPIPRFWNNPFGTDVPVFEITGKCTCSLLFPYITTANGFDTGLAVANTSFDPGNAAAPFNFGFTGIKQAGPVQFWYYSTTKDSLSTALPGSGSPTFTPAGFGTNVPSNTQCTNEASPGLCPVAGPGINNPTFVQAGGVMQFPVGTQPAAAGPGNPWGLLPAPNFTGYIIAQASFQYCHGFAFISGVGLGGGVPTASYIALSLDTDAPPMTLTGSLVNGAITLTSGPAGLVPRNVEPGEGLDH